MAIVLNWVKGLPLFDLSGRLGRWAYFKRIVVRSLFVTFIVLIYLATSYFFYRLNSPDTPLFFEWLESQIELTSQNPYSITKFLAYLLGLLIYIPIEIRRANDINLKYRWVILTHISFFIPVQVVGNAINFIYFLYGTVIYLILQFKPGKTFNEWSRSKDQSA